MKTIKAASIVLDFELYPRNNIDSHNVTVMVEALEAGTELPPVIIDRKSKRCIDGFHRVKAHLKWGGPDAEIACIEKTYKNEAMMFLDAARYNAAHGCRLDQADRVHCAIVAQSLQISLDELAGALNMPVDRLSHLVSDRTAVGKGGLTVPLKRTNRHMSGKKLTSRQQEANERSSGMNQVFYCNQLIDLIESKLLDETNDKLLERLRVLHGLLEELLAAK